MSRAVSKLAVIGAGQMGGGIAQTAAVVAKIPVIIYDSNDNQLAKQRSFIGTRPAWAQSNFFRPSSASLPTSV